MIVQVATYKSQHFQNDVNALSFKENNFTFKRTRSVPEGFKNGYNMSHLIKIEKEGFQKPLYTMKIQKDLVVILILEHNVPASDYRLTLLRAVRLHQLEEAVKSLDVEEVYSAFNFKDFWT
jgi:arabinogalactan endo-1,4-beta-galactosidase